VYERLITKTVYQTEGTRAEEWVGGKALRGSLLYYRVQGITDLHLMSNPIAHCDVFQSNMLLEETKISYRLWKKTAERIRADSPHERVSRRPSPLLRRNPKAKTCKLIIKPTVK